METIHMNTHKQRFAAAVRSGGVSSGPVYAAAIRAGLIEIPNASAILDFGSGTGSLLPVLSESFADADLSAVDIMGRPQAVPESVSWYVGDLNLPAPVPSHSFDLVYAVEVIEHLENPRHMFREIARMLRQDGVSIITTPNTGSIKSLMTLAARGHHALFDDANYPAHISPIGVIDMRRIAAEVGLSFVREFHTDDGTIPKLLRSRWQSIPLVGKSLRGRLFSDNVGIVLKKSA
jgi:2-polyprenyl-3-methyl-5-hydroxy-6-metoxy-1,4-benzoquinol methylase